MSKSIVTIFIIFLMIATPASAAFFSFPGTPTGRAVYHVEENVQVDNPNPTTDDTIQLSISSPPGTYALYKFPYLENYGALTDSEITNPFEFQSAEYTFLSAEQGAPAVLSSASGVLDLSKIPDLTPGQYKVGFATRKGVAGTWLNDWVYYVTTINIEEPVFSPPVEQPPIIDTVETMESVDSVSDVSDYVEEEITTQPTVITDPVSEDTTTGLPVQAQGSQQNGFKGRQAPGLDIQVVPQADECEQGYSACKGDILEFCELGQLKTRQCSLLCVDGACFDELPTIARESPSEDAFIEPPTEIKGVKAPKGTDHKQEEKELKGIDTAPGQQKKETGPKSDYVRTIQPGALKRTAGCGNLYCEAGECESCPADCTAAECLKLPECLGTATVYAFRGEKVDVEGESYVVNAQKITKDTADIRIGSNDPLNMEPDEVKVLNDGRLIKLLAIPELEEEGIAVEASERRGLGGRTAVVCLMRKYTFDECMNSVFDDSMIEATCAQNVDLWLKDTIPKCIEAGPEGALKCLSDSLTQCTGINCESCYESVSQKAKWCVQLMLGKPECSDSDNGMDSFTVGTTTGVDITYTQKSETDKCTQDKTGLIEYYCSKDGYVLSTKNTPVACEYGCEDGKCLGQPACTDTDPGDNTCIKGTISYSSNGGRLQNEDVCISYKELAEYNCNAYDETGQPTKIIKSCAAGKTCEDGACVDIEFDKDACVTDVFAKEEYAECADKLKQFVDVCTGKTQDRNFNTRDIQTPNLRLPEIENVKDDAYSLMQQSLKDKTADSFCYFGSKDQVCPQIRETRRSGGLGSFGTRTVTRPDTVCEGCYDKLTEKLKQCYYKDLQTWSHEKLMINSVCFNSLVAEGDTKRATWSRDIDDKECKDFAIFQGESFKEILSKCLVKDDPVNCLKSTIDVEKECLVPKKSSGWGSNNEMVVDQTCANCPQMYVNYYSQCVEKYNTLPEFTFEACSNPEVVSTSTIRSSNPFRSDRKTKTYSFDAQKCTQTLAELMPLDLFAFGREYMDKFSHDPGMACKDPDAGDSRYDTNDQRQQSTTTGRMSSCLQGPYTDYCETQGENKGKLVEFVCGPTGYVQKEFINCRYGCEDGRCSDKPRPTVCTDPDGEDVYTKTLVTAPKYDLYDYCSNSQGQRLDFCFGTDCLLNEQICTGKEIKSLQRSCIWGCKDGRCRKDAEELVSELDIEPAWRETNRAWKTPSPYPLDMAKNELVISLNKGCLPVNCKEDRTACEAAIETCLQTKVTEKSKCAHGVRKHRHECSPQLDKWEYHIVREIKRKIMGV